jgi:hypothetical protein
MCEYIRDAETRDSENHRGVRFNSPIAFTLTDASLNYDCVVLYLHSKARDFVRSTSFTGLMFVCLFVYYRPCISPVCIMAGFNENEQAGRYVTRNSNWTGFYVLMLLSVCTLIPYRGSIILSSISQVDFSGHRQQCPASYNERTSR